MPKATVAASCQGIGVVGAALEPRTMEAHPACLDGGREESRYPFRTRSRR